jgi:hypothetical protein
MSHHGSEREGTKDKKAILPVYHTGEERMAQLDIPFGPSSSPFPPDLNLDRDNKNTLFKNIKPTLLALTVATPK